MYPQRGCRNSVDSNQSNQVNYRTAYWHRRVDEKQYIHITKSIISKLTRARKKEKERLLTLIIHIPPPPKNTADRNERIPKRNYFNRKCLFNQIIF